MALWVYFYLIYVMMVYSNGITNIPLFDLYDDGVF